MRLYSIVGLLVIAAMAFLLVLERDSFQRIKGANIVNPPRPILSSDMAELHRVNADWVAVIPYGFSRSGRPELTFDHNMQWWGERTEGNNQLIQFAKENGFKVMLKPHVWIGGEGWAGDYKLASEEEWQIWERDFRAYIIHHAKQAETLQVELFCIGTEYRIPAKERPEFWRKLIDDVRKVYKGKLTYAANWDNYQNITWWDELDFIGIDSYFPLAEGEHPSIEKIREGWEPVKKDLQKFSTKWDKKILFTEYGFQSANGAAANHWEVDKSSSNTNDQIQADAYEATFQAFENERWFAGGFFWKWHFNSKGGNWRGTEWTPQGKPAEEVIAKWYGKEN